MPKTAPNVLYTLILGKEKCLEQTCKMEVVWTGSHNCFGRELHVVGPATEKARRP